MNKTVKNLNKLLLAAFILILVSSSTSLVRSLNEKGQVKYRKFYIYNPLPYTISDVFIINLTFEYGSAFNNSIRITSEYGKDITFQLLNVTFYPDSPYMKGCSLAFYDKIPGLSVKNYIISYSNSPITREENYINYGIVHLENYSIFRITNSYYNVTIGNSTFPGIWIEAVKNGENWINFTEKPVIDWSIVLSNGTVIEPSDFNYSVTVLSNGSILSIVLIEGVWNNTRIQIMAKFSNDTPIINIEYKVSTSNDLKALYLPRYRIPITLNNMFLPGYKTYNTLYLSRLSIYPPLSMICFSDTEKSLTTGVISNFNNTLASMLKRFNNTIFNASKFSYAKFLEIKEKKRIALKLYNLTDPETAKKLSLNDIHQLINELKEKQNLLRILLEQNLTRNILYINNTYIVKRILGERWGNTIILGYQLNLSTIKNQGIIYNGYIALPSDIKAIIAHMYQKLINTTLVVPLQFSILTHTKESVEVDDLYNISISIRTYENISCLNISLSLPKGVFEPLSKNLSLLIYNLTSYNVYNYTWSLIPRQIGYHSINISSSSNRGYINLTVNVNVTSPPIFRAPYQKKQYNLTVVVERVDGKTLPGRIVKIFDPALNKTVCTNATDVNGTANFFSLTEGVYILQVQENNFAKNFTLSLFSNTVFRVHLNLTDLIISVLTPSGKPVPGVLIQLLDNEGNLVYTSVTNSSGIAVIKSIPINTYSVSLAFFSRIVSNLKVDLSRTNFLNTTIDVFVLKIKAVRDGNKPLALAKVEVIVPTSQYGYYVLENRTNLNGECSFFLLSGKYKVKISKGEYVYEREINLTNDMILEAKVSRGSTLWLLTLLTIALWSGFGFYWYRSTSETKREENKYIQLLKRLEDFYSKGLIEDKFYFKLKKEYEEKLRRLRGE